MKKSEIVIALANQRSPKTLPEEDTRRQLYAVLNALSFDLAKRDQEVDLEIGNAVIKHMRSIRGNLSLRALVIDIDLILKRIT